MADTREVPREPTEQMMCVGGRSLIDGQEVRPRSSWADQAAIAWRAMYDAAPVPAPPAEPTREPDGYAYEYDSYFGLVRKFDNGGAEYNGSKPQRQRPYWLGQ